MDDETRAAIERAHREHEGAKAWERETRKALFQLIQDILISKRATPAQLIEVTQYSAERLRQIKNGRWYRTGSH